MKRMTKIAIGAAALVGIAGAVGIAASHADDRGPGHSMGWWRGHGHHGHHGFGPMMGHHGPHGLMEAYDTNGDGKLTQAEVDAARAERFKTFDKDADGVLTLAEYEALWLDAMRERMVDRFQEHDDDGDAKVTPAEFGEEHAHIVRRMDRNGDGVVDETDMRRRHMDDDEEEEEEAERDEP
jgi:hypothetical protein